MKFMKIVDGDATTHITLNKIESVVSYGEGINVDTTTNSHSFEGNIDMFMRALVQPNAEDRVFICPREEEEDRAEDWTEETD